MTHDMTPTERQAAIIADLEARIILLTDDLFYARASNARLTVDLEQANGQLAQRDAKIATLHHRIAGLEIKLDAFQQVFERLRDCDWVITPHDRMDAVREIARKALEWKGAQP